MPKCPHKIFGKTLSEAEEEAVLKKVESFMAECRQLGVFSVDLHPSATSGKLAEELLIANQIFTLSKAEIAEAVHQTLHSLTSSDLADITVVSLRHSKHSTLSTTEHENTGAARPVHRALSSLEELSMSLHHLTELRLHNVVSGRLHRHNTSGLILPSAIGCLDQLQVLAIEGSELLELPASVGHLGCLKELRLSHNRLVRLPYTCIFCTKLEFLDVTDNSLTALPGFIHELPNLRKVYRLGNHSFQDTISRWYRWRGRDYAGYVPYHMSSTESDLARLKDKTVESLQVIAAIGYLSRGVNYWTDPDVPYRLRWLLHDLHSNMCAVCNKPQQPFHHHGDKGFNVYSIQEVFLGNTYVPFLHWACSKECAETLKERESLRSAKSLELWQAARGVSDDKSPTQQVACDTADKDNEKKQTRRKTRRWSNFFVHWQHS